MGYAITFLVGRVQAGDEHNEDSESAHLTMIIKHNGKEIARHWDGGEPEDNLFHRDWSWVSDELERAYALGLEDGKGVGWR